MVSRSLRCCYPVRKVFFALDKTLGPETIGAIQGSSDVGILMNRIVEEAKNIQQLGFADGHPLNY